VLWSLSKDLAEFPEAPPPGLVTVPSEKSAAPGYYAMAGYRAAGERAIRIDMLERLADMLRDQDTRGGFEATADMLSITGMTLEQFANLMEGLGYKAAKAEREKARAAAKDPKRPRYQKRHLRRKPPRLRPKWKCFTPSHGVAAHSSNAKVGVRKTSGAVVSHKVKANRVASRGHAGEQTRARRWGRAHADVCERARNQGDQDCRLRHTARPGTRGPSAL